MDPYIGEVRLFAGNFAPVGWAFCNGSILAIAENDVLFTLIGTTYGGDGQTTFALPDLRSRVPVHTGNGVVLGQMAGVETVALTVSQLAAHSHTLQGISTNNASSPANAFPAAVSASGFEPTLYGTGSAKLTTLAPQSIGQSPGGNQPHTNIQPYVALSFIIALSGVYPSQN